MTNGTEQELFGGDNADSHYDEGLTASMRGDWPAALAHFEKVLQRDPARTAALQQVGRAYTNLGQFGAAVDALRRVLRANPNQMAAYIDLGYALLGANETEQARRTFDTAMHLQANNTRVSLGLAECAFQEGEWEEAAVMSEMASQDAGASFAALFLWARAAKLSGSMDYDTVLGRAEKSIQRSIEASPEQAQGYYFQGEVYFLKEDFQKALESYQRAEDFMQADRHYAAFNTHFTQIDAIAKRGLCLQRLGDQADARAAGQEILSRKPEHKIGKMLSEM
jgi:tetratricopeptide (TPR) repeat protein